MKQTNKIIGRKSEQEALREYLSSDKSEFIALYGRRRVGKTFLIREALGSEFIFYATGIADGTYARQIANFNKEICACGGSMLPTAQNWDMVFDNIYSIIKASKKRKKKVVFLDEVPWMNTPKSGFLSALDYFWNHCASARNDLLLIICGSAASWIIENVVNNTGGLHNRLTGEILLQPFTLGECRSYYLSRGINIPEYRLAEAYMVFGGIPYYMSLLKPQYSLPQNIDAVYFAQNAPLRNEYINLYRSLFRNADVHMRVIETLAKKNSGKTREDIVSETGIKEGGRLSKVLLELSASGFIREYLSFGKKKRDCIYQLVDPFTLFCLRFSKNRETYSADFWSRYRSTPAHSAWAGYAFEILCLLHIPQIRNALGISGVLTEVYSWRSKTYDPGAQIDLVIERADQIINLCEMKYTQTEFIIDKEYDLKLRSKKAAFLNETKTRKAAHTTMITTYGLKKNAYRANIPFILQLDNLFD